jgi:hypothetical protein
MTIGFIGLGNLGTVMVNNLIEKMCLFSCITEQSYRRFLKRRNRIYLILSKGFRFDHFYCFERQGS